MTPQGFNVLVLCTGNSARSVLAEALINSLGEEAEADIHAFSAGSRPKGQVHPAAFEVLKANGIPVAGLRSKSWEEFALSSAPVMDVVITVCDSAASETCPIWPQAPAKVHWGLPDPAAVEGTPDEIRAAFQEAFDQLQTRVARLVDIVEPNMDRDLLQARLQEVHQAAA